MYVKLENMTATVYCESCKTQATFVGSERTPLVIISSGVPPLQVEIDTSEYACKCTGEEESPQEHVVLFEM